MIITRLNGGLGNQLFQYAMGRRLAIDRGVPLKLDTSLYLLDNFRSYSLGHFKIQAEIATAADVHIYTGLPARMFRQIDSLTRPYYARSYIKERKSFEFNSNFLMAQKSAYLDGFWQNERYFQPISTLLRDDFQLRDAPTGLNLTIADKIASTNSVSVHVRRGDYVSNPTVQILHGLLPISYYQRAIALIQNYTNEAHYFVFSDDPEWARAHLDIRGTTMFISHNNLLHDYEDLRLMSLCHHHIVANSTFSWWGAWLSNYPEKIVIAPRPWMNSPDFDTHDFFPANWMQMDLKEQPNSSS